MLNRNVIVFLLRIQELWVATEAAPLGADHYFTENCRQL